MFLLVSLGHLSFCGSLFQVLNLWRNGAALETSEGCAANTACCRVVIFWGLRARVSLVCFQQTAQPEEDCNNCHC